LNSALPIGLEFLLVWEWDIDLGKVKRNKKGEEVAQGTYIYLVTNNAGNRKIGKIAIIIR